LLRGFRSSTARDATKRALTAKPSPCPDCCPVCEADIVQVEALANSCRTVCGHVSWEFSPIKTVTISVPFRPFMEKTECVDVRQMFEHLLEGQTKPRLSLDFSSCIVLNEFPLHGVLRLSKYNFSEAHRDLRAPVAASLLCCTAATDGTAGDGGKSPQEKRGRPARVHG
jgi:hypothetical protein